MPTQAPNVASSGGEDLGDDFSRNFACVANHDLMTGGQLGAQLAPNSVAVKLIEFLLNGDLCIHALARETIRELLCFRLDLTTDVGIQRKRVAAYL